MQKHFFQMCQSLDMPTFTFLAKKLHFIQPTVNQVMNQK